MKKIILIVGASGVGKDTLLRLAKKELKHMNFVKRYIDRKPDKDEDNYFLEKDAFEILERNSFFISSWSAHDNIYGISKTSIKDGVNIISISRSEIECFEDYFADVTTVDITLPRDILKHRLISRGRESKEQIQKRLDREYINLKARKLIEFSNIMDLLTSSNVFKDLLRGI